MKKERILWADSLKGRLMILVIIGHAIQYTLGGECFDNHAWNLIYSFHMPAFMAVSGWFAYRKSKKTDWAGACRRRFWQILVPYFVWSFIVFLQKGNYTFEQLSRMIMYPDSYFWFLWVLFWICVIFELAKKAAELVHIDELVPISLCCLLLLGAMVTCEIRILGFQFLAYYFLFYTLGYCVHRCPVLQVRSIIPLIALAIVWGVLAWSWKMHSLPTWVPVIPHVPTSLLQYAYRGLSALVAILVMFGFAPKVLNGGNTVNRCMVEIGVYSLGLYVIHLVFMGCLSKALEYVAPEASLLTKVVVIAFVDLVLSIVLVQFLKRNKYTSKILLGKI